MIRSFVQGVTQIQSNLLTSSLVQTASKAIVTCDLQSIKPPSLINQQIRTTHVLKRRRAAPLSKVHKGKKMLKHPHFTYEVVENKNCQPVTPIKVVLIANVQGLGSKGDVVEVRPFRARNHLILPGLAVYASPENIERYSNLVKGIEADQPSSHFAEKTASELSTKVIHVSMNMKKPWKLEPWHVRVAFRKAGIHVPEYALILPKKPIEGPDFSLQDKEFLVKVKINSREEANVRCRINHQTVVASERMPWIPFHWEYMAQPIFAEDAEILEELARNNKITRLAEED